MKKKDKKKLQKYILGIIITAIVALISYFYPQFKDEIHQIFGTDIVSATSTITSFDLSSIPEFTDSPFVYINNNKPNFTEEDYTTNPFENYSELDGLGRCGVAFANICRELMPTEPRGESGMVKPSGWKLAKYDIVDGKYLYNRCHLIGYQLAGENANQKNLITGTRYLNVQGMLPFENEVVNYIKNQNKSENKHVLDRVTPIFENSNLVASGVQMEAYSVEDNGQGVCFNVYVYNAQPGIEINYANGESSYVEK